MTSAYSTGRAFMPLPGSLIDVLEYKVSPLVAAVSQTSEKVGLPQCLSALINPFMTNLFHLTEATAPVSLPRGRSRVHNWHAVGHQQLLPIMQVHSVS